MTIEDIINHCRHRTYMSGIQRDKSRIQQTQEVFTPTQTVQEDLDEWPQDIFSDPGEIFLDNSCGDGQFLSEVLIRKVENGLTFEQALQTVRGVDLQFDNVVLCRERLLCGRDDLRKIVEKNIVCANALTYHLRFDGTDPEDTDKNRLINSLFDFS